MASHYRSEIDGLRALAILPVIFFHADVPGFGGGFVGVDVFFVISGYLITNILLNDMGAGKFSILKFYERRARRILPALFFVLFIAFIIACVVLDPVAQVSFGKSLVAAILSVSNIFFFRESGYFDSDSELKPLLHTWSLGVEEQFYLFFPFILWVMMKAGRRYLIAALLVGALISLIGAQYALTRYPSAAFYLLPTRAWELLMGAMAACHLMGKTRLPSVWSDGRAGFGIAMVVLSVAVYNNQTPFPGLYALLPTVGTVVFILYASPAKGIGRIFSAPVLVKIGLLSYSAYMLHQPILAYGRVMFGHLTAPWIFCALCLTALMSWLSWRFVETPFRRAQQISAQRLVWLGVSSTGALLLAAAWMVQRAQVRLEPVAPVRSEHLQLVNRCFLLDHSAKNFDVAACMAATNPGQKRVLLIGDSHAASLYPGLKAVLGREGVGLSMLTAGHCLPFVATFPKNNSLTATARCADINQQVLQVLQREPHDLILMSGHVHLWAFNPSPRWTYSGYLNDYLKAITSIRDSGLNVAVIGQFPIWPKGLPNILALELGWDNEVNALAAQAKTGLDTNIFTSDTTIGLAVENLGVPYLSVLKRVCSGVECTRFADTDGQRRPFAVDYGHLSLGGSRLVATEIKPLVMELLMCKEKKSKNCKSL